MLIFECNRWGWGGGGENYGSSSTREALRRRPDPFGFLATTCGKTFASNNLRQNVLEKRGLTNTSSPTRTFGFSAKATPLIARPNLTRRRRKRRTRGRILGGRGLSLSSIASAQSGGGSEKIAVSYREEEESSKDSIPSELRST